MANWTLWFTLKTPLLMSTITMATQHQERPGGEVRGCQMKDSTRGKTVEGSKGGQQNSNSCDSHLHSDKSRGLQLPGECRGSDSINQIHLEVRGREKSHRGEKEKWYSWRMAVGGVCAGLGNMEMSALSEDSTFLPSGTRSVRSTGTEQCLSQAVNRPAMKAIYITCPAHTTLAQNQGGRAGSQH